MDKKPGKKTIFFISGILLIIAIIIIIIVASNVNAGNFKNDIANVIKPFPNELDWIDSFELHGKYNHQVVYKANSNIEKTSYKDITNLLKNTYQTLERELSGFGTIADKYNSDCYKAYKEFSATIEYNDMQYYVDYDTSTNEGAQLRSDSPLNHYTDANDLSAAKTADEFLTYINNEAAVSFKVVKSNFPQNDILYLYIVFSDDFYTADLAKQYSALRKLYSNYEAFLVSEKMDNKDHEMWIYAPDSIDIIYKIIYSQSHESGSIFETFGGKWFDNVSEIPLYAFDIYPQQINNYDNESIRAGESLGQDSWDVSFNVFRQDYESEKQNSGNSESDGIPDNAIKLYFKGSSILCGSTKNNYGKAIECIVNGDDVGFSEMEFLGEVFSVPSNTYAIVLERSFGSAKVRFCEGEYKDKTAWVAIESID